MKPDLDALAEEASKEWSGIGSRVSVTQAVRRALQRLQTYYEVELEAAYQVLDLYGVPRERAKSIPNGIEVLATRFQKAKRAHEAERDAAVREAVERGDFALVWKPTVRELFRKGLLADGMTDVTWLVREGWYLPAPAADEQKG